MKNIWCVFVLSIFMNINAQNLLKNSGFEILNDSVKANSSKLIFLQSNFICTDWNYIENTTPDYFNKKFNTIPFNEHGYHPVIEGEGYVGFVPFTLMGYSEPITGELKDSLMQGVKYLIRFNYRFAALSSFYCLRRIELYLSPTIDFYPKPAFQDDVPFFYNLTPGIKSNASNEDDLINDGEWHMCTSYYVANGGEKYVTFGVFQQSDKFYKLIDDYNRNGYVLQINNHKESLFFNKKVRNDDWLIRINPLYFMNAKEEVLMNEFKKEKSLLQKERPYKFPYYFIDNITVEEVMSDDCHQP